MVSHTVPKNFLEQFTYSDPRTGSPRLWQYHKDRAPWWKASPRTATAWEGHFADPANKDREAEIELQLKQEFEDPVNDFIEMIGCRTFFLSPMHIRLLAGYMRLLFARSRSRQAASAEGVKTKLDAFRSILKDDQKLSELAAFYTLDMIRRGYGIERVVTKADVIVGTENIIAEHTRPDEVQRAYIQALETMFTFPDETMLNGDWGIMQTDLEHPFIISDAPVVTFERSEQNKLYWGLGFAHPNVEVFLPVSPTTCLHVLPRVKRTRRVQTPSPIEANMGQAAFARQYCFANMNSLEIDAVFKAEFGKMRMGVTGFNTQHIDYEQVLFNILMGRHPQAA